LYIHAIKAKNFPFPQIVFSNKSKSPLSEALTLTNPMKKENYAFRLTGFLAGVGDSTVLEKSPSR
jgi:hypothetical protein